MQGASFIGGLIWFKERVFFVSQNIKRLILLSLVKNYNWVADCIGNLYFLTISALKILLMHMFIVTIVLGFFIFILAKGS